MSYFVDPTSNILETLDVLVDDVNHFGTPPSTSRVSGAIYESPMKSKIILKVVYERYVEVEDSLRQELKLISDHMWVAKNETMVLLVLLKGY